MLKPCFARACILIAAPFLFSAQLDAQSIWTTATDGDWSEISNWSSGVPNGAAVDAGITATGAPYVVTADIDVALNLLTIDSSDATLLMSGRNWSITDRIQIDAGNLESRGVTTITGDIVNAGGTIEVVGANVSGHATLTADSLVNDGSLLLRSETSNWSASLVGDVTNNGDIQIQAGAGGLRNYTGTMQNNGSVLVDQRLNVNGAANVWNQMAGSITGNEAFVINDGIMNIDGGNMSGQVIVDSGTINVLGTSTATGAVQAQGATQLAGTINNGLTVTVQGSANGGHATASTQAGFSNSGILALESINSNWNSNLDAALGMTNNSTGTIKIGLGNGGPRNISGSIINQGTIDGTANEYRQITGSLQLDGGQLLGDLKTFNTAVTSTGSTSGDIKLHDDANTLGGTINSGLSVRVRGSNDGGHANTAVAGSLSNQGTFILDSENSTWSATLTGDLTNDATGTVQTLVGAGGSKNFDGLLTNQGTLDFQTGTNIVGTGLSMEGGSLTSAGLTLIDGGATLQASGGSVTGQVAVRNGSLEFQPASTLSGQIETHDASSISGTVNAAASVIATGSNLGGNSVLTSAAGFANDGTIELTSVNSTWASNLDVTNGLTNNGLLRTSVGAGGIKNITGQIDNFGQVDIQTFTTLTGSGLTMKSGSITGGELLYLSGGATFTAEAGTISSPVAVNDGQITFAPGSLLVGEVEARGNSTLSGTINTNASVSIKGANLAGSANLVTAAGAINDGLIELDSIDSTWASTLNVGNGLINNGTIRVLSGAGGIKFVTGDLTNNGTLDGVANALQFDGTLNMNSGSAIGTVIAKSSDMTFGSAATGQIFSRDGTNTATGTIGSGMSLWVGGDNDGGTSALATVGTLNIAGNLVLESTTNTWASNISGSVLNQSTGVVEVNAGSGGARNLNFELDNDGEFIFRTDASLGIIGATHDNRGTLTIEDGRLDLVGDTFENSGLLQGNGILDLNNSVVFNNSGIVGPGLSPGTLTIDGDFVQDSSGTLAIELFGLSAGQFDVLAVLGDADLAGVLEINANYGFETGDTFRILTTDLVNGTFDSHTNSLNWDVVYGSNFVDVVAIRSVPEPGILLLLTLGGIVGLATRRRA